MFLSTDLTVDRIHFVEYGVLGLLCFHATSPQHVWVRRAAYAMVAVFAIGFLDEFVQGILASRYYALRDVVIDLMAGFLPMLGLLWWPLAPTGPEGRTRSVSAPSTAVPSRRVRASDTCAFLMTSFLVFGAFWVRGVSWDMEPLYGTWERENRCEQVERIRFGRDETVLWEDDAGGRARGRYRVRGNRLDGPLLEVEVLEGKGSNSCAWTAGEWRRRYFRVDAERLLFVKERAFPFRRGGS
jgi:hypothetical protein